jgi:hypothetical protein
MELFDPEIFKTTNLIWKDYSNFYSEEYWNNNVLDNSLQQLLFYTECKEINTENALIIIDAIHEVILKCKKMAYDGSKNNHIRSTEDAFGSNGNYRLYDNKILHTSNHVRVSSDHFNAVYLTYDNPNFIITQDARFIDYTDNWYSAIQENSYILGKGSGHHAADFFNVLLSKIEHTQQRISNLDR